MKPRRFNFFDGLLLVFVVAAALANVAAYNAGGASVGEFISGIAGAVSKRISANDTLVFRINSPVVSVNGRDKKIDGLGSAPFIQDGATLLPLIAVYEMIGGSAARDAGNGYVTAIFLNNSLKVKAGEITAEVNGRPVAQGVAPVVKGNSRGVNKRIDGYKTNYYH